MIDDLVPVSPECPRPASASCPIKLPNFSDKLIKGDPVSVTTSGDIQV